MRENDPLIWVNRAFQEAKKYDKVVISDCRRANEHSVGIESGFLPIHIDVDVKRRIKRLEERDGFYPDISLLENKSETGADGLEFITVDNNGTLEELYNQIDEIMKFNWSKYIKQIQYEHRIRQMY